MLYVSSGGPRRFFSLRLLIDSVIWERSALATVHHLSSPTDAIQRKRKKWTAAVWPQPEGSGVEPPTPRSSGNVVCRYGKFILPRSRPDVRIIHFRPDMGTGAGPLANQLHAQGQYVAVVIRRNTAGEG